GKVLGTPLHVETGMLEHVLADVGAGSHYGNPVTRQEVGRTNARPLQNRRGGQGPRAKDDPVAEEPCGLATHDALDCNGLVAVKNDAIDQRTGPDHQVLTLLRWTEKRHSGALSLALVDRTRRIADLLPIIGFVDVLLALQAERLAGGDRRLQKRLVAAVS